MTLYLNMDENSKTEALLTYTEILSKLEFGFGLSELFISELCVH